MHDLFKNWTSLFQSKARVFVPLITRHLQTFVSEVCGGAGGFVQLSTNLPSVKRAGGFSFLAHLDNIQTQASVIQNLRSGTFSEKGSAWRRKKSDNYYKIREIHLKAVKILSFAT